MFCREDNNHGLPLVFYRAELEVVTTLVPPAVEFQDIPEHVKPKQVVTVTIASKPSSTSMDALVLFDEMQQRYITNIPSASWMSVVLSGSNATKADDDQWVFEELFAQNPV
jgi:hypothetical protein